jgi:hypothetical protein
MKITELLTMLELFPPNTPMLNTPDKPHYYVKDKKSLGLSVGQTIFNQNPTTTIGSFVELLKNMSRGFETTNKVYLTHNSHQVGNEVQGIKMTLDGVRLVAEQQ